MKSPFSENQPSESAGSNWHHSIFEDTERHVNGKSASADQHDPAPALSPFTIDPFPADSSERHDTHSLPFAVPAAAAQSVAPVPPPLSRRPAFWTAIALVIGVLTVMFLFNELTTATSLQGATVGNMINLRAVAPGVVSEVSVDEAGRIEAGQVIARLDASGLDTQLQWLEEILDLKRLEATQVASAIDEERLRLKLLHEISRRSETRLGMEIEELEIQLELASALVGEVNGSASRGSAKRFEFLGAESSQLRTAKRLEEKHGELELQKLITSNAAEGRHYHDGVVRSWLDELQLHAAKVATEISETELEAAKLRTEVALSTITAHRGGRVFAVHQHPGSSVQAGDPLVTLETDNRAWIIASFKYAEAEDIAYGDRATIDFPALGDSITGSVVAIGRNVISATDADSPFLRRTPGEVLVEIEPDAAVDQLRSGISAQVSIRTSSLDPVSWIGSLLKPSRSSDNPDKDTKPEPVISPQVADEKPVEPARPKPAPPGNDTIAPMDSPFDFSHR